MRGMAIQSNVVVMGQLDAAMERSISRDYRALFLRHPDDLQRHVPWEDVDAIVIRSPFHLTGEMVSHCPRLRLVIRAGVGTDHVDLDALASRGIAFHTCPGATNAVAELVICGVLALFRDVGDHRKRLAEGAWTKFDGLGRELSGATLGIAGFGRIGERVVQIANVFGASCIAIERDHDLTSKRLRAESLGVALTTDFAGTLGQLDVLVLACPLTAQTRRMLDAEALRRMSPRSIVVNVGRGALWDQDAVYAAIMRQEIAGAVCDVYEHEPPPREAFFDHPRIIATPHIGAQTREAHARVAQRVASLLQSHLPTTALVSGGS